MKAQGQSGISGWKELGIRDAIEMSVRLSFGTRGSLSSFPFWYIDLNCGCGKNVMVNCDGSPIEFLKIATNAKRYYHAFFCDRKEAFVRQLRRLIKPLKQYGDHRNIVEMSWEDNKLLLPKVASVIRRSESNPHFAVGCILSDPNGPSLDGFPLREMRAFCRKFPRIDVILNVNTIGYKRNCAFAWSKNEVGERFRKAKAAIKKCPAHSLQGIIDFLPKNHWIIREPVGKQKYIILVGRNMSVGSSRSLGFYKVESKKGREIIRNADS